MRSAGTRTGTGDVVDHAAGQCGVRAAELFLRNLFARQLFHHRWASREDRTLAAQDHQRNPVAQCQLRQPIALRVAAGPDTACQSGEVLGADHHRGAVDESGSGDDPVGRDVSADQSAELAERALVEKVLETRAGVELALAVMLGESLGATHRTRLLAPTA